MKRFIGTVVMGAFAVSLIAYEWDFRRHARDGRALVMESALSGRGGRTIAEVVHVVGGKQIRATLRAFSCHLRAGQKVRILYQRDDPENVVLDWFWQRHFGSTLALALFAIIAVGEVLKEFDERRRKNLMLHCDDYVQLRVGSRGVPALPIDTAPRLWDRELDGSPPSGA